MLEHIRTRKDPDYATRVLGGYRMGARAGGAIRGVRILRGADSCPACRAASGVYAIEEAPIIPIAGCTHAAGCRCSYTPVMSYDVDDAPSIGTLPPAGDGGAA
jgi:hypothetical protein